MWKHIDDYSGIDIPSSELGLKPIISPLRPYIVQNSLTDKIITLSIGNLYLNVSIEQDNDKVIKQAKRELYSKYLNSIGAKA